MPTPGLLHTRQRGRGGRCIGDVITVARFAGARAPPHKKNHPTELGGGVGGALRELPDETVIDGEVVALDATGKPVFSLLQDGSTDVHFYVFDLLMLSGQD